MPATSIRTVIIPAKRSLSFGGLLAAAANLVWLGQAWIIATILSDLLAGKSGVDIRGILVFASLGVVRALFTYAAEAINSKATEQLISGLRADIIQQETGQTGWTGYGGSGAIAALAIEKTDSLRTYLNRYYPAMYRTMIVPPVILLSAFSLNWVAGLIFLFTAPMIPLFMILIGWAAQSASRKHLEEITTINDQLVDRIGAALDFRLLGARDKSVSAFVRTADRLRDKTMAVLKIAFLSSTVLELFAAIGVAMVAVFLGFTILGEIGFGSTRSPVTAFEVIWLLLLAPEFYQPLRDLSAAWHDKATGEAVAHELESWRSSERIAVVTSKAGTTAPITNIVATGLTVARSGKTLIYPDLFLKKGEAIAITGPSGVGKTTLLQMLAGLVRPTTGEIRLDGAPMSESNIGALRKQIGWMPQAPNFVAGTLRGNIAFDDGADVWPALAAVRVETVVANLPDQDLFALGETGGGLSGGEARRIMLARALFRGPDFLLADEPTADLDETTKRDVIATLMDMKASGTCLFIATHDPVLIAALDQEIRLEAQC